jgi:methionyl-tRNA synthetase
MSKSLGNVVNPYDLVGKYGTDAVRYYLLGALPAHDDGDYSQAIFETTYGTKLANGLGNLTARVQTMLQKYSEEKVPAPADDRFGAAELWKSYDRALADYRFDLAVQTMESLVTACDKLIEDTQPWKMAKEGQDVGPVLYQLAEGLRHIGLMALPFVPGAAEKILGDMPKSRAWGGLLAGTSFKKGDILFPRLA